MENNEDIVRVIRIIEYVGPRKLIEEQVKNAIHGTKSLIRGVNITAVTLGEYPEIMKQLNKEENDV